MEIYTQVPSADEVADHRVAECSKRDEEPAPPRPKRHAAVYVAHRPGIGGQQRPDHRGRAVTQEEFAWQHLDHQR
jgi:hypothetical protein